MSQGIELKALQARWHDLDENEAISRRDVMLAYLIENCQKGNLKRPLNLDLKGIDLCRVDLADLDLSGYDLSHALLTYANLNNSNLSYSILYGAHLEHAQLESCEFFGANLEKAALSECDGLHCGFGGANLQDAVLINANLSHAVLSKSNLRGADFRATDLSHARLSEADLTNGVYTRANLDNADLKHSDVQGASFNKASLREARMFGIKNFRQADWIGADIRDMDLRGAYLIRRYISDENYLYEFRQQNRLHLIIYNIWWFTSDCGRSLFRWLVWMIVVNLGFAWLYTIVGLDYGDHETWYSPIYFSFVTLTTLGYGDIVPSSIVGQFLVSFQALTGYMGLGGLLSILGNKFSRRAE